MALTSSRQIRAARALLDWEQSDLSKRSGVSINTVSRMETGAPGEPIPGRTASLDKIRRALEAAGIEFTNGRAPGVRLREPEQ